MGNRCCCASAPHGTSSQHMEEAADAESINTGRAVQQHSYHAIGADADVGLDAPRPDWFARRRLRQTPVTFLLPPAGDSTEEVAGDGPGVPPSRTDDQSGAHAPLDVLRRRARRRWQPDGRRGAIEPVSEAPVSFATATFLSLPDDAPHDRNSAEMLPAELIELMIHLSLPSERLHSSQIARRAPRQCMSAREVDNCSFLYVFTKALICVPDSVAPSSPCDALANDQDTLDSIPAVRSSNSLATAAGEAYTSCPVCMCEYVDGETVRVLPCLHRFHKECVDTWLCQGRPTCPVCRQCPRALAEQYDQIGI